MTRSAAGRPVLPRPPAERAGRTRLPAPGECHLWLVPVRPRPGWLPMLDAGERHKAGRLTGTPAGDVFVTSRGTQRLVGSAYLGVPPSAVVTDRDCPHCAAPGKQPDKHGRPRFRAAPFDYSVSHTEKWLLLAVAGAGLVGADIEDLNAVPDPEALAKASLSPGEQRHYARLRPAEQPQWLLSAWTRKEAAMKLTGLGLQAPPNLVDVRGPVATVGAVPGWPAGPIHLHRIGAPGGHVAALATTVPLLGLQRFELPEAPLARPA